MVSLLFQTYKRKNQEILLFHVTVEETVAASNNNNTQ
jgi:hypothetical protein